MSDRRSSTRQRLIQAAIQLFIAHGVTETTTRQIADLAEVNEVTLFRHFGSKHGLLLAVMEDTEVLSNFGTTLGQQASQMDSASQALKNYARVHLQALEQIQEFVRSLIGEAAHYPIENRQALSRGLSHANRYTAQYLATVMRYERLQTRMSTEKLASLLNSLLLGYAVLEFTSEFNELWQSRESFIEGLVEVLLYGAVEQPEVTLSVESTPIQPVIPEPPEVVQELPTSLVHQLLRRAKKRGLQDYAIAYVLFGAGLTAEEVAMLERKHSWNDRDQHLLRVPQGRVRQVPLNQWILGRRYGTALNNPLTQWLKSRKDHHPALFLGEDGQAITTAAIWQGWEAIAEGLLTPEGEPPAIEQTQRTWCIEMLMRGVFPDDLCLLTGRTLAELQPCIRRARERRVLEQVIQLDHKSGGDRPHHPMTRLPESNLPDVATEP